MKLHVRFFADSGLVRSEIFSQIFSSLTHLNGTIEPDDIAAIAQCRTDKAMMFLAPYVSEGGQLTVEFDTNTNELKVVSRRTNRRRLKIVLDCDGVLSDFTTAVFRWVEALTGEKHFLYEVTSYDVLTSIGHAELKEELKVQGSTPGWCSGFEVFPGVKHALDILRQEHKVVCVTAPMNTPNWCFEREKWLHENLGFDKDDIVFTSGKHHVAGDIFVDDSGKNCLKWFDEHPNSVTVVWDRPYNQDVVPPYESRNFMRINNWHDFIATVGKRAEFT